MTCGCLFFSIVFLDSLSSPSNINVFKMKLKVKVEDQIKVTMKISTFKQFSKSAFSSFISSCLDFSTCCIKFCLIESS